MANQFESQVVQLTNQFRSQYGLRPLSWNSQLGTAAQNHTLDMARMRRMSHSGSDGSQVGTRVQRVRYPFRQVGENVAHNQRTAQAVLSSWMQSPGHRKNILNPNFTEIGVGYYNGYWTQVFGSRR